jgi:hypothetical protein
VPRRAIGVDPNESIPVALGEQLVGLRHPTLELSSFVFEAIALGRPLTRSLQGELEQKRHIRDQPARRPLVQLLDAIDSDFARTPLVGGGRVSKPITNDDFCVRQRRLDYVRNQIRARGREQQGLCHGFQLYIGVLDESPDSLRHLSASGLSDQHPTLPQCLGQHPRLRRLSRSIDALEGDEHALIL